MASGTPALTWLAFGAVIVLGGFNAVAVYLTNRELAPLWGASSRFLAAGAVLAAIAVARRSRLPRGRAWGGPLAFGVLGVGITFGLFYYGLVEIEPGMGQTLMALVPVLTLTLATLEGQEPWRWSTAIGAAIAAAGVATIFAGDLLASGSVLSFVAVVASAACVGQAAILVRRFPAVDPLVNNAIAMPLGGALLLVASLATGTPLALPARPETWAAVVYNILGGSVLMYSLYIFVLSRWPASRTSFQFVLMPISAIVVSAMFLDEPLTWWLLAGGSLVVAGVYLGVLRRPRQAAAAAVPEAVP